ncbi:hypothetical protein LPB136_04675 [Tenacibaculum todarodis]|uniref:UDP-glycosyltransferase n=1 Tax=Tenacibaculum todarodis TaxID=1850252 RepID=A0A1L3JHT2_9FLAO|nr:hypothetical protein [Tenacibaculum todarodis]APG64696.1 hypothetical protein LPB136_04675 [Tenacibaculum todarodis]
MKKLGLVITDGVGFRNYILSNFLEEATKEFDSIVILSCLPAEVYKGHTTCNIIELEVFNEQYKTWFFRKTKEVAHLKLHAKGNFGIQHNLSINKSKLKTTRGYGTRLIYKFTRFFHSEKNIQTYQKLQNFTFSRNRITNQYQDVLKQENFDLLFFTHQRPPYIAPLVYVAQKLKIKTAAFIFSWDNLASKGRMASNFDYYLVWSNLMRKELKHFYSEIKEEEINVIGTPQFEPYAMDKYKIDRSSFFKKFNLDTTKGIICYSCADKSIGANDSVHIASVMQYLINNPKLNLQLLVRTSPAEDGLRFEEIKSKFPEIIWNIPKWELARNNHAESWSQRIPSIEDVKDLRALLEFSDLNINMCSTMGLDFLLFDKPVIYTVFGNEENGLYNDQLFLKYAHLEHVINSKAITIAKNEEELHEQIKEALTQPNLRKAYRKNLIDLEIGKPLEGTSKRIVEALKSF